MRWLEPLVDFVARVNWSIHRKLLFGFLTGAVLLVAMAVLSLVVIGRMDERMEILDAQAVKVSRAQQMLYDVTAQSHYRAMAILRHAHPDEADEFNGKVEAAKADFASLLTKMREADPANAEFYQEVDAANDTYAATSGRVLRAFENDHRHLALRLHLDQEHPDSHVIEDLLTAFIDPSGIAPADIPPVLSGQPGALEEMDQAQQNFQADKRLLQGTVIAFSAVSVLVALLLGFALSWAFILPVRRIEGTLAEVTKGRFDKRVDVPNRDEFGRLSQDLNSTIERVAALFESQRTLARRLGETNASLVRASEAKSRFLASVSHELRTPMNAILGFTDALLAGVDGPLNDEQKESLGWVQRGGRDLLGLINEILDLSRIEAGKLVLDPQPFDPRELVESVVAQHRSLAAQKGIRLVWRDAGAPAEVVLDQQRVRQILVNLTGNALKFTQEGTVDVDVASSTEGMLRVTVNDTGPGIPADQHEAIFEEFRQVGTGATGTGLGLAISRRLANAMGGQVTLESEPGQGCSFHLTLPVDSRDAASGPTIDTPSDTVDGGRVLLSVDDDPSVAPLLQKMIAGDGYRVVGSGSASSAVSDAARLQPAAILLDLLMPERNGVDILAELKTQPATSSIPVIVVSVVDPADVPDSADGLVSKPVSRAALLNVLAQHTSVGAER